MGALANMLTIERLVREQDQNLSDAGWLRGIIVRIGAAADDPDEVRRLVSFALVGIHPAKPEGE